MKSKIRLAFVFFGREIATPKFDEVMCLWTQPGSFTWISSYIGKRNCFFLETQIVRWKKQNRKNAVVEIALFVPQQDARSAGREKEVR
jgi:hypothetical protein